MSELHGNATGRTRAEIIAKATQTAATYYDTKCVAITLHDEESDTQEFTDGSGTTLRTDTTFTAAWTARVKHQMDNPGYGFPKCIYCKEQSNR